MNALIRTDASESAGTGHLTRCMTLGSALMRSGVSVTLACQPLAGPLRRAAEGRGFELVDVEPRHAAQLADADATLASVGMRRFDWIVVDHYGLDAVWEQRMRTAGRLSLAIDDLANRRHDCDVLLDQNLRRDGGSGYDQFLPAGCERLFGPRYALIDDAFALERARADGAERRAILVSFGGSDPRSLTLPVLRALLRDARRTAPIDVVVGALHRDSRAIDEVANGAVGVTIHKATQQMARLMAHARIYIGAGGTTSWERCCLALPGVVVATAENQVGPCLALAAAGSHIYLGEATEVTAADIAQAAFDLLADPSQQERLSRLSAEIVDGCGVRRVVARLEGGAVRLRSATRGDSDAVFEWRNHPAIRRFSADEGEIPRSEHTAWYERVLVDPNRHLLIAEDDAGALGVLRYDVDGRSARVSVYLVPMRIGCGAGGRLLAAGERWLAARHPEVCELTAEVRPENRPSVRLFSNAGYRQAQSLYRRSICEGASS
jgi:UDP-2,4-diacetamido-2,4,6-trideoxy-beta-L-altropyranose hydrolase